MSGSHFSLPQRSVISRWLNTCQPEKERKHRAACQQRAKIMLNHHILEQRKRGMQSNECQGMVVPFLVTNFRNRHRKEALRQAELSHLSHHHCLVLFDLLIKSLSLLGLNLLPGLLYFFHFLQIHIKASPR